MRTYVIAAALVVLVAGLAGAAEIELQRPVRLKADGKYIDTGKQVAHSGPVTMDFDKDGKTDLLVGNFRGTIQFFRNTGSNAEPVYEDKGFLEADGEQIRIHNW